FLSYEILNKHKPAAASLGRADLERLGRGIDNWGAVDLFGCFVAGPAWRERQVPDALIHRWARSPDRWWRRAALVCTVPLNMPAQGGKGDPERTLAVCAKLIDDRDDMVVKALSWSLRALARQAPAAVTAFLTDHHPRLAARVTREVRHKLSTGLKNPRPNKPRRGLKPS
ncbi:MAG TPA: DNA alkylation repair protein, partial [Isosphaeraceae bacterium]|nr:DNA alkylation repair protein [Isosphaeraceae bacterium]